MAAACLLDESDCVLHHDGISFDGTFGISRLRMPPVPVVGVDGEGRTALLGAGTALRREGEQRHVAAGAAGRGRARAVLPRFRLPDATAGVLPSARRSLCSPSQSIIKAVAGSLGSAI